MGQCLSSFNNPSVHKESDDVSFENKDMDEWTVDDVYNWLCSVDVNITDNILRSVTEQFKQNNVNGLALKGIDTQYLVNKIEITPDDADEIISTRDRLLPAPVDTDHDNVVHTQPNMQNPAMNSSLDINMTPLMHDDTSYPRKPNKVIVTNPDENALSASSPTPSPTPSPVPMEINKNSNNERLQVQQQQQQQLPLDPSFLSELVQIGLSGSVFSKSTSTYEQPPNPSPKRTCGKPPGGQQLSGIHMYGKTLTPAQLFFVESKSQEDKKSDNNNNGTTLNIYAPIYVPKQYKMPKLQKHRSAPIQPLSAIDETKSVHSYKMMHTQIKIQNEYKHDETKEITESKSCDNHKSKRSKRKEVDPWKKFGAKGNIYISRYLTEKVIPNTIMENIPNLFEYMDKSTMMQRNDEYKDQYKNDKIKIFNYDFHNKHQAALYCVARKHNGSKNFKWKMQDKLYTAKDIRNEFGDVDIPKSSRHKQSFLKEVNHKQQIISYIKRHETTGIISKTKWTKTRVNTTMNNKQRIILAIDQPEFIKKVTEYIKTNNNVDVLPILMFSNNGYHVEYIHIVTVTDNIDIGISYKYEKNNVKVTEIVVKKEDILSRHMLVSPHDCHCLDNFTSIIDTIKIGNVECEMNQIKDLKKRLSDASVVIDKLKKEDKIDDNDSSASTSPINGSPVINTPHSSSNSFGSGSGSGSAESHHLKN